MMTTTRSTATVILLLSALSLGCSETFDAAQVNSSLSGDNGATDEPGDIANKPPGSTPGPIVAAPTTGPVTAQSFVKGLKMGINVERSNAYTMGDFGSGTTSYAYLKSLGFTHVRIFYPFRPTLDFGQTNGPGIVPTKSQLMRLIKSAKNANAVGLKVMMDLTDVMGEQDFAGNYGTMIENYLDMATKAIAEEKFEPSMLAVGDVNEWEGSSNAVANPRRKKHLSIMRKNLPGFVLITGPTYWKYYERLLAKDFEVSTDPLVIYDTHAYDDGAYSDAHWANLSRVLGDWSKAHNNAVVVFGESGFGGSFDGGPSFYYNGLNAMGKNALNLYPTLWSITNGSSWRMNVSPSDYHLDAALEYAMKALFIK